MFILSANTTYSGINKFQVGKCIRYSVNYQINCKKGLNFISFTLFLHHSHQAD